MKKRVKLITEVYFDITAKDQNSLDYILDGIEESADVNTLSKKYSFGTVKRVGEPIKILMGENEIVVSGSHAVKHGTLHGVRNLECQADSTDVSENTNDAALETRIEVENNCPVCGSGHIGKVGNPKHYICGHGHRWPIIKTL